MAGLLSSLSRYVTVDDGAGGRCPAHFSLRSLSMPQPRRRRIQALGTDAEVKRALGRKPLPPAVFPVDLLRGLRCGKC